MRDIVDGQLVASGFCSASQIGQRPRDRKGTQIADFESTAAWRLRLIYQGCHRHRLLVTLAPRPKLMVRRGRRGFHGRACDNPPGCGSTGRAGVMATAPWWWPLLITMIGTPLLGALLYLFVPLLRAAKRLGIWLSNPGL